MRRMQHPEPEIRRRFPAGTIGAQPPARDLFGTDTILPRPMNFLRNIETIPCGSRYFPSPGNRP